MYFRHELNPHVALPSRPRKPSVWQRLTRRSA
jgi:hypothetical protein